jgi:hypothetical protein
LSYELGVGLASDQLRLALGEPRRKSKGLHSPELLPLLRRMLGALSRVEREFTVQPIRLLMYSWTILVRSAISNNNSKASANITNVCLHDNPAPDAA